MLDSLIISELEKAMSPHCKRYMEIYTELQPKIEALRVELMPLVDHFHIGEYEALNFMIEEYNKLAVARYKAQQEKPLEIFGYRVSPSNVQVCRHGFMFWHKWHIESTEGAYDYDEDKFIHFDFKLFSLENSDAEKIKEYVKNMSLKPK